MRKPNLFIVGAPKCGTTSLWSYLRAHPEIFMVAEKELYFFDTDLRPEGWQPPPLDQYLRHFAAAKDQKMVGEATPSYLRSRCAPMAIKVFSPAAQIIIMLRNPVDVMYSLHSAALYIPEPIDDFETALEADAKRSGRELVGYRQFTDFSAQVRRYFDVFGRENVHTIVYDDLKADAGAVYRNTLYFLGVDPNFIPKLTVLSAHERVRSKRLQRILVYPPKAFRGITRRLMPRSLRTRIFRAVWNSLHSGRPRPPMDPRLRRRLQLEFEPEVAQLSNLLGRDLSGWCRPSDGEGAGRVG